MASESYRMHLIWQLFQVNHVVLLPQTLHMTSNKATHEMLVVFSTIILILAWIIVRL